MAAKNKRINAALRKERFTQAATGVLLFIVTGIMPLAAHGVVRPTPPELWDLIVLEQKADAFSYWRAWFLIIPALVMVLYVVSDLLTGGRRDAGIVTSFKTQIKNPPMAAVMVYSFFVLLSAICSPYRYTALHGTVERFEGVFVLLAYMVVFVAVKQYARDATQIKCVLAGVLFSSLCMGAVGLSQLLGHDFFGTSWGSIYLTGQPGNARPVFTTAYGMLFNPNTYGLYASMLAPFLLLCGFTYQGHKIINTLLLAAGALMLAGIVGSGSLGGLLGAAASISVVAVTATAHMVYHKKWPHRLVMAALLFLIVCCVGAYCWVDMVNANVNRLVDKLKKAVAAEQYEPPLQYAFDGDTLHIRKMDNASVSLTADGPDVLSSWLTVRDGGGRLVEAVTDDGVSEDAPSVYQYEVPDYGRLSITRNEDYFVLGGMYLSVVDGDIIPFRKSGIAIDIAEPVPTFGFEGYETWANSRGYIWSRALPLMGRYLIIGSGPDSFINVFPQDDILGKLYFLYNPYMVVDKAHNLYIQTGVTTGMISMLALVFLMGYYMVTTLTSLVKSRGEPLFRFGLRLGLLAAVSAFAVSSMATDSTIPSTGMFYCLLGLGYALNAFEIPSA